MKKKLVLILVMVLALSTSLFAAPKSGKKAKNNRNYASRNYQRGKDMGLGLNLGWPGSGLAVRYHNDDFRMLGAVSFLYDSALAVDFTGEYIFARIECDDESRHVIDLSAGLGAGAVVPFRSGDSFAVAFEAGLIANYDIPDTDFSLFIRGLWRPTLVFADDLYFSATGFAGSLGFTYNFPLE